MRVRDWETINEGDKKEAKMDDRCAQVSLKIAIEQNHYVSSTYIHLNPHPRTYQSATHTHVYSKARMPPST